MPQAYKYPSRCSTLSTSPPRRQPMGSTWPKLLQHQLLQSLNVIFWVVIWMNCFPSPRPKLTWSHTINWNHMWCYSLVICNISWLIIRRDYHKQPKTLLQFLAYLQFPLFQTLAKPNIPGVCLAQSPFIALPLSAFREEMPDYNVKKGNLLFSFSQWWMVQYRKGENKFPH